MNSPVVWGQETKVSRSARARWFGVFARTVQLDIGLPKTVNVPSPRSGAARHQVPMANPIEEAASLEALSVSGGVPRVLSPEGIQIGPSGCVDVSALRLS